MFERLINIIGEEKMNILKESNILLIGVGGVGGYVLECLIRSGIENITIADFDIIELSNLNRQIISNQTNLKHEKVEEAKKRALEINPNANINLIKAKLTSENIKEIDLKRFDFIIDACDDAPLKCILIKKTTDLKIAFISSMGTGNRFHPEELTVGKLKETIEDPLARKIRRLLKTESPKYLNIKVLWSKEVPKKVEHLGTICSLPMAAGSIIASHVINKIIKRKEQN